ncbi:uncharacterized protein LOC113324310 [Papaver somniferum]|uniref:uncharacterized protein LOC113324310 n=1 Tax=Papaver somniferum TaxID=3469 RepID=UPI000E6F5783|nr:uncharacterized protein LOC113324310 [Papaver somniferum]
MEEKNGLQTENASNLKDWLCSWFDKILAHHIEENEFCKISIVAWCIWNVRSVLGSKMHLLNMRVESRCYISQLLTSAGINIAACAVLLSLYSILRKQRGITGVYSSRRLIQEHLKRSDPFWFERFVPYPRWVATAWSTSEKEILAVSGLDTVAFLIPLVFSCIRFSTIFQTDGSCLSEQTTSSGSVSPTREDTLKWWARNRYLFLLIRSGVNFLADGGDTDGGGASARLDAVQVARGKHNGIGLTVLATDCSRLLHSIQVPVSDIGSHFGMLLGISWRKKN